MKHYDKCIILDFDCTIGYFKQIIYLLNIIEKYNGIEIIDNDEYFQLFDCYPYIFRPKIYDIFNLILTNKEKIKFFILYTNNQNIQFVNLIFQYIKNKLKYNDDLFDYMFFNKSREKRLSFIKKNINYEGENELLYCYIDDTKNINMSSKLLRYIHCEKYIHNYNLNDIIKNFPFSLFENITKNKLRKYFLKYFEKITNKQLPRSSFHSPSTKLLHVINVFIIS